MATYYIDYNATDDSKDGKAKTVSGGTGPWKRCPGMVSFAGSYSHSAGDQFIFKGGVTWVNACFRMAPAGSGNSGASDYYGVDATWYTGGSWARPIFSAGGARITAGGANGFMTLSGLSYIRLDNIEFTGFYWDVNDSNWQDAKQVFLDQADHVVSTNLYFHGWTHSNYAAGGRDIMYCIIGYPGAPYNPGSIVDGCIFDGSSSSGDSGTATYGGLVEIKNCVAHDMPCALESHGIAAAHSIHDSLIYNIIHSFDSGQHEDATLMMGSGQMYNLILHDIYTGAGPIYLAPAWVAGDNADSLIYNNVFYNFDSTNGCVNIQLTYRNCTGTVRVFNNTLLGGYDGVQACVATVNTGYTLTALVVENNHMITSYDNGTDPAGIHLGGTVTTLTADHNTVQTKATANGQGYVEGNKYAPTLGGATIGAGMDDSAYVTSDINGVARKNPPDTGAYEYSSGSGVNKLVMVLK